MDELLVKMLKQLTGFSIYSCIESQLPVDQHVSGHV